MAALVLLLGVGALLVSVTTSARLERADFVFNNGAEVQTLDPAAVTGVPEGRLLRAIFEGLTVKHPVTLEPLPGMAERWELSEDGRTYRFHLRPDAVWTNGDPVTAHDFEWSWQRCLHPLTAAEYAYQLWYVVGGREFTQLPIDRLYVPGTDAGVWLQEMPDGGVRLGLTAFALRAVNPAGALELLPEEGAALEAGTVIAAAPGARFRLPCDARVVARNPDLAGTVEGVAADPYEAQWLLQLELAQPLEALQQAGTLLEHEAYRREWIWPHHVGIRATDDLTLEVVLETPTPFFIDLVSFYPLFPVHRRSIEEAQRRFPETWQVQWVRPEHIVTNGPYRIAERRVNDRVRLVKHPGYWDAANVAMETIDVLAVEHYGTMLNLYLMGEVDWIDKISPNLVPRLLEREDFAPVPYLGTYFYRVNVHKPPFDDRRVRRALALTIDRRAICHKIMKAGQIPNWGFMPHGLPSYVKQDMPHSEAKDLMKDRLMPKIVAEASSNDASPAWSRPSAIAMRVRRSSIDCRTSGSSENRPCWPSAL